MNQSYPKYPTHLSLMSTFKYWSLQITANVIRYVVHFVLSMVYWKKGKTVPAAKNPLLLKSAAQLAEEIRDGKLKSVDVIKAYIARIQEVDPYINATVDRPFTEAIKEANEVDALIASRKSTKEQLAQDKPLLGVPITIKNLLTVKGLRSTGGSLLFENQIATEDAPSVALMKQAGAIILATTNSPEMGMNFETNNNVHGRTSNPYDTNRTSGGSSGGESALIAAAGSVLGLGNDLLGSIRVPCHFTGLFGHKPTVGLVPNLGVFPVPDPAITHYLFTGPMCRYAIDLELSMRVLSSQSGQSLKFGAPVNFSNMKICYLTQIRSPMVAPVNSEIALSLKNAVTYFEKVYGTTAKEINLPLLYDVNRVVINNLLPPVKDLKTTLTGGKGAHLNPRTEYLKFFFGKSTMSHGILVVLNYGKFPLWYKESKVPYYQELLKKIANVFDHILDDNTVLLMPTLPCHATYHSEMLVNLPSTCFTSIFNFIGLPVTQCPLGFSKEGLPHGIQVVGKKNNDALTIAFAAELEKAFGGWTQLGSG